MAGPQPESQAPPAGGGPSVGRVSPPPSFRRLYRRLALPVLLVLMEHDPHDLATEGAAPEGGREVNNTQQAGIQEIGELNTGSVTAQLEEAHRLQGEITAAVLGRHGEPGKVAPLRWCGPAPICSSGCVGSMPDG